MLLVGNYTDYTLDPSPNFPNSSSLIQFNNLDSNQKIASLKLQLYLYGANSDTTIYASKTNEAWNESTAYPGPQASGNYGQTYVPHHNAQNSHDFLAVTLTLDPQVVTGNTVSLKLQPLNNPNSLGVVFCSANSDAFCTSAYKPKLIVEYEQIAIPIPSFVNPTAHYQAFSNCDASLQTCPESLPLTIEITKNATDQSQLLTTEIQITSDITQQIILHPDQDNTTIDLKNGQYSITARNQDQNGRFSIQTTPLIINIYTKVPIAPKLGLQKTPYYISTLDPLIINKQTTGQYTFNYSLSEDFSVTEIGLPNKSGTYFIRAKYTDTHGLTSIWSTPLKIVIDLDSPILSKNQITNSIWYPNLSSQQLDLDSSDKDIALVKFTLTNTDNIILWDKSTTNDIIFPFSLPLSTELEDRELVGGQYQISTILIDTVGNISKTYTQNFFVEYSQPFITITSPKKNFNTNQSAVTISGSISYPSSYLINNITPEVTCFGSNQSKASIKNNKFECKVNLTQGNNNLKVVYHDATFNLSQTTTIYSDTLAPQIELQSPILTSIPQQAYTGKILFSDNTSGLNLKSLQKLQLILAASPNNPIDLLPSASCSLHADSKQMQCSFIINPKQIPEGNGELLIIVNDLLNNQASLKKQLLQIPITPPKPIEQTGNVYLNYNMHSKLYTIQSIVLPVPILENAQRNAQNQILISGIHTAPNLHATATIQFNYSNLYEAITDCQTNEFELYFNMDKRLCIEQNMGIASYSDWRNKVLADCGYAIPIYTSSCMSNIYTNSRNTKTQTIALNTASVNFEFANQYGTTLKQSQLQIKDNKFNVITEDTQFLKARYALAFKLKIANSQELNLSPLYSFYSNYKTIPKKLTQELSVVYFNQYLEPNNSYYPKDGWQMCGAASSVLSANIFNKVPFNKSDEHSLKAFMYADSRIDPKTPKCGVNKGGAFTYTSYGCNMSYAGGIQNYLSFTGLKSTFTTKFDLAFVKNAINKGHPLIFGYGDKKDGGFGHIATITGYTNDDKVIVQDTYTDVQNLGRGWKSYTTGKSVKYDLYSSRWPINYLIEVYQ
jgi:hypothetical protein